MPPLPLDTLLAHVDGMRRLARSLVHDPALAEDVAQDAVLVALAKGPRHQRNVAGWLNGIVRNIARDRRRAARRREHHERRAQAEAAAPDPLDRAVQVTEQKRLLDAVQALEEPYRSAIWQRYFDDLSPRAMAREADVSVETVHTRLKRARRQLRARLDADHEGRRRDWALALAPLAGRGEVGGLGVLLGGLAMTWKAHHTWLLAALLLLGIGAWGWLAFESPDASTDTPPDTSVASDTSPTGLGPRLGEHTSAAPRATDDAAGRSRVRGRVVDEALQPLAGVDVRLGPADAATVEDLPVVTRSDASGAFTLSVHADGEPRTLAATAPDRLTAFAAFREGDGASLLLRLPRRPSYVYRFLDRDTDEPLEGVRCEVVRTALERAWIAAVHSDADGRVRVPSPTADALETSMRVRVTHPGHRPLASLKRPAAGSAFGTPKRPKEIYLERAAPIRIQVHDPRGRPLAGVRVRAWAGNPGMNDGPAEWKPVFRTAGPEPGGRGVALFDGVTDVEGAVAFAPGPANMPWSVYATTDGGAALFVARRAIRPRDLPLILVLRPTLRVVGRVLDEAGRPARRTIVRVEPQAYDPQGKRWHRTSGLPPAIIEDHVTHTDAEGRFALEAVIVAGEGGTSNVDAHRADLGPAWQELTPPATAGRTQTVELQAAAAHPIQVVRVVDENDHPVHGARVMFTNVLPAQLTDARGEARVQRYPTHGEARATISVAKAGYRIAVVDAPEEGELARVVLHRPQALLVHVEDAAGRPVPAYVDVYAPAMAERPAEKRSDVFGPLWLGRARADAAGYARVEGLPPGPWFVRAWSRVRRETYWDLALVEATLAEGGLQRLTLAEALPPPLPSGVLEGTVRGPDGSVAQPSVILRSRSGRGGDLMPDLVGPRFRFEAVPAGEWELHVSAARRELIGRQPVVVRAGAVTRTTVALEAASTWTGRLLTPAGDPVAGVDVRLRDVTTGRQAGASARTEADGSYAIRSVVSGTYRVELHRNGTPPPGVLDGLRVRIPQDASDPVELRLRPAGTLALQLDDERFPVWAKDWAVRLRHTVEGQRAWNTRITITGDDGIERMSIGLFHGRTPFGHALAPGTYTVRVRTGDGASFEDTFTVTAGRETVVPVRLSR